MYLHNAKVKLLKQKGRSMTTSEIADELNRNKWYSKKDGSLITAYQIHGRTSNYFHMFKREGSMVALINQPFQKGDGVISRKRTAVAETHKIEISDTEPEINLLDEKRFKKAGIIDSLVPDTCGLYCVRIINPGALSEVFSAKLTKRG